MARDHRPEPRAAVSASPAASSPATSPDGDLRREVVALKDRVAELELAAESAAQTIAARDATIAELQGALDDLRNAAPARVAIVKKYTLRFRGKDYEHGEVFPFDPRTPPHDAPGPYVEGLQYTWRDATPSP